MTYKQNGNLILTASEKSIFMWDSITMTNIGQIKAPASEIRALAVDNNSNLFYAASKGLIVYDFRKLTSAQPYDCFEP